MTDAAALTIRALVFDFDGLLLETEGPAYESWSEIYREHGHELPLARWHDYIGRESGWFDPVAHLADLLGEALDGDAIRARRDLRKTALIEALDLRPGVRERIAEAKARGLRLAIASSSPSEWVCGHLDRLAFRMHFDAIACCADGIPAKPAPDLYLAAVRELRVAPREAVAIEDSANGIAAAKAAGLWCVAVPNPLTEHQDLGAADLRLRSLDELDLDALLARLRKRARSGRSSGPEVRDGEARPRGPARQR